jgi:nucleotide-binding universal stress UspA family protein
MSKVTVGVDGSPAARAAVEWAVERSQHTASTIELVSVLPESRFGSDFRLEAQRYYEANLTEVVGTVQQTAPGREVSYSLRSGSVAQELIRASEDTDLLVVGTDKSSRVRRLVYGTVPLRLAALSACPLVVVPRTWTAGGQPVLLTVGDDEPAPAVVAFAPAEAEARGVPLHIVHVWTAGPDYPTALYLADFPSAAAEQTARQLVEETVRRVQEAHPGLEVSGHVAEGPTIPRLIEAAEEAQLLVVGRHGRGIFRDVLQLGSIAHDMLLNPPVPVAVVPGQRRPDLHAHHAEQRRESTSAE